MNSINCLAHTGSTLWILLAIGLACVLAGAALWRLPIVRAFGVLALVFGATLTVQSSHSPAANAACTPTNTSLISGTFSFVGYEASASDLPTITATDGTNTITALWDTPVFNGSDTEATFSFPAAGAGSWNFSVNQTGTTPLEFMDSTLPFSVNSSPMLTGGPFDASTSSPTTVDVTPLNFTFRVSADG